VSPKQWELSTKGECYICHKHKYVCIFFDRRFPTNVTKVTDKTLKEKLKSNLNLTRLDVKTEMPIILGTVTPDFSRKLKMMNANLFSLLSLSEREEINWTNAARISSIREGTIEVINKMSLESIKSENTGEDDGLNFNKCLNGWRKVLYDKIVANKETDILCVNSPKGFEQSTEN